MEAVRRIFKTRVAGVSVHVHSLYCKTLATLAFLSHVHTACRKITCLHLVQEGDLNAIANTGAQRWPRIRNTHFRRPHPCRGIDVGSREISHRSLTLTAARCGIRPVLLAENFNYALQCSSFALDLHYVLKRLSRRTNRRLPRSSPQLRGKGRQQ